MIRIPRDPVLPLSADVRSSDSRHRAGVLRVSSGGLRVRLIRPVAKGDPFVAEQYAKTVTEMARRHRREVARLVQEVSAAESLAEVERIKAELAAAQDRYEAALMAETIALQARNDRLAAKLRTLES